MATVDDLQNQIYILSGVFGGFLLVLIVCVITLIVQIKKLQTKLENISHAKVTPASEDLSKRGFLAYTGPPTQTAAAVSPPPATRYQDPAPQNTFSPPVSNPQRSTGFSYENNGYQDQFSQQRPRGLSPMGGTNQGVQVLPRNPQPARGPQLTDGYY